MGLTEALESAGQMGHYQIRHFCLIALCGSAPYVWTPVLIAFQAFFNDHHCKVPANRSIDDVIPHTKDPDGTVHYDQCQMYSEVNSNVTTPCTDGWTYEPAYFDEDDGTIVMEWDLVCGKEGLVEVYLTIQNVGCFLGMLVCTPLADKIGRKPVFFLCQATMAIAGIAGAFAPNFIVFTFFGFIRGMAQSVIFTEGNILATELFPRDYYTLIFPLSGFFTGSTHALLVLYAYLLRNWRHLQLAISVTNACFVFYFWWCPESLRWLVSQHRYDDANKLLKTISEVNHGKWDPDLLRPSLDMSSDDNEPTVKQSEWEAFKEYMRHPKLVFYLFVLSFISFTNKTCYMGLQYLQNSLSGNLYIMVLVNALAGMPGCVLAIPMLFWCGRKITVGTYTFLIGLHMALSAAAPNFPAGGGVDLNLVSAYLATTAKIWVAGQHVAYITLAQEMAPTNIRSTYAGITMGFGFLGSIASPFIAISLGRIKPWLPGTIFGLVGFTGAFLMLFVPETLGRGLPTSVEQIACYPLNLRPEEKAKLKKERKNSKLFSSKKSSGRISQVSPSSRSTTKSRRSSVQLSNHSFQNGVFRGENGHCGQGLEEVTRL